MKKYIVAVALATCAGAGSASAADWTGYHAGVNVGLAGDEFTYPFDADIPPVVVSGEAAITSSGFIGGVQVGYDKQFANRWVLGVEADISASDLTGEVSVNGAASGGITGNLAASVGSELNSFGTIRARLGYAYNDNLMPYVTAGAAFGEVSTGYSVTVSSGGAPLFSAAGSKSSDQSGWTVGAGVEYQFADRYSLKTEYLYADLGEYNVLTASLLGGSASIDTETTIHVFRVGVNYRF